MFIANAPSSAPLLECSGVQVSYFNDILFLLVRLFRSKGQHAAKDVIPEVFMNLNMYSSLFMLLTVVYQYVGVRFGPDECKITHNESQQVG